MVLRGADSAGVGAAAQQLGELVAEKVDAITGGQLTVEYYPNSEMGGDMDIQQQMLDGTLVVDNDFSKLESTEWSNVNLNVI